MAPDVLQVALTGQALYVEPILWVKRQSNQSVVLYEVTLFFPYP